MLSRLLIRYESSQTGRLGLALGSGVGTLGLFATVSGLLGTAGPEILASGAAVAVLISALVYAALLERRLRALSAHGDSGPLKELREEADEAIAEMGSGAGAVLRVVEAYENRIRALQSQLERPQTPRPPVLVEGGRVPGHEVDLMVDTFFIDAAPVVNYDFATFIADEPDWRHSELIESKYGVPYYLCEFAGSFPDEKWDHPVVWVSWFAAAAYCNWRSRRESKQPVYVFETATSVSTNLSADGWRLPTEAEWEKAARAGEEGESAWPDGITRFDANFGNHYRGTTSVGRFGVNRLGLCDMLGNVKEWCHDWYTGSYPARTETTNPTGPGTGQYKVFRGSSWMDEASRLTFSQRGRLPPQNTNPDFGFRCVRRPSRFSGEDEAAG